MNWQPLLDAGPVVQLHVGSAVVAILIGAVVLWRRKGGAWHRALGRLWMVAMLVTAIGALWINDIRLWGPFSPLHVFSVVVPVNMALAVWAARTGRIAMHRGIMRGSCIGALGIAGAFALMPGRMLWDVLTGGATISLAADWLAAHGWTLPLAAGLLPPVVYLARRAVRLGREAGGIGPARRA